MRPATKQAVSFARMPRRLSSNGCHEIRVLWSGPSKDNCGVVSGSVSCITFLSIHEIKSRMACEKDESCTWTNGERQHQQGIPFSQGQSLSTKGNASAFRYLNRGYSEFRQYGMYYMYTYCMQNMYHMCMFSGYQCCTPAWEHSQTRHECRVQTPDQARSTCPGEWLQVLRS